MANSMLGYLDAWLVNRADQAIAVVQERAGVSLPTVQIGFVLLSTATYWIFMIYIAVHLGDVLPRWAAIASASLMIGLATLVTAFSFARRIRVQMRDAQGEWTDAKHQLYLKTAVHFRVNRFRARIWGLVLTALISLGACAGLGGGIFAWFCASAVIEELSLCAFPRQPKKDEAASPELAAGRV
jgi:hypothetical protein